MPLPTLQCDDKTLDALHEAVVPLAAIRLFHFEHDPNWLELGLKVVLHGVSTDVLPTGDEVTLDYVRGALVCHHADGQETVIPLSGHSQKALFERLLAVVPVEPVMGAEECISAFYTALEKRGRRRSIKPEAVSDERVLHVDIAQAGDYARAVYGVFTGMARFRARLNGLMTPMVVWPEHFDLSMLWFAGHSADEKSTPHLNFGFSPPSPGIDDCYLYAYAYPYPASFDVPALPPGAHWNETPWRGVVVPYSEIASHPDGEAFVEATCMGIFRALRPLLG